MDEGKEQRQLNCGLNRQILKASVQRFHASRTCGGKL